jgi:hypothetical protein
MAKPAIITYTYDNHAIDYQADGWFNATQAAAKFGKEPTNWLYQRDTVEYISAIAAHYGKSCFVQDFNEIKDLGSTSAKSRAKLLALTKKTGYVRTKLGAPENGGGTWLHPKLAVNFARWLDVDFAVWCDAQIDSLIRGKDDWRRQRHVAASTNKMVNAILQMTRGEAGKDTQHYHYANEAKLVNWALCGQFTGLDRDGLSGPELDLLAHLEERNAVLLARGVSRDQRQPMLKQYAMDWRLSRLGLLED